MKTSEVTKWREGLTKDGLIVKGLTKSDIIDLTFAIDKDLIRLEKLILGIKD